MKLRSRGRRCAALKLQLPPAGQISGNNIEIGIVGKDRTFRVLTAAEVSDYLSEVS